MAREDDCSPQACGELQAELVDLATAETHVAAWGRLLQRAIEPNAFYAPAVVLAAMRNLPECRDARIVMVWRRADGAARSLVGLLPLNGIGRRYLLPLPILRAEDVYGRLTTPLIDPAQGVETVAAMLSALKTARVHALYLPYSMADGEVSRLLLESAKRNGLRTRVWGRYERASLDACVKPVNYLRETLSTRRRKEIERQRRRLAETGAITFEIARTPGQVSPAIEDFLILEAESWKGENGTALLSAPGSAAFLREAASALAQAGTIRVARLKRDGRTIAAGVVISHGSTAYYFKTTFDQGLAAYSPGILLTLDLTNDLLADPGIRSVDSIAIAGHPMIDRIWLGRLPIMSIMIETGRSHRLWFSVINAAEALRERARTVYRRMRARRLSASASR